jgi:hypothetical protein
LTSIEAFAITLKSSQMPSMAATTHKGKLTIIFDTIYNTQKKAHNCLTMSSATHKGKLTIAFDVIHKSQKKDHKFCLQSHPQPPKESSQNFAFNAIPNLQREPFSIVSKTSSHPAIAHTIAKKPTLLLL